MEREPTPGPIDLGDLRARVDATLRAHLRETREGLERLAPSSVRLVDELVRLVDAGGKRLRPTLCVLGHVAAGGEAAVALPAAAALELFHTFALVHDDVMDDQDERRGVPATHRHIAEAEPGGEAFGRSAAILVGDLAFALSADLVLRSAVPADRALAAAARFRAMAVATAAGQFLDLSGGGAPPVVVASLKTGAYTAEAPLAIGAELAGAAPDAMAALQCFARPLGIAFQLLDDVADGTASGGAEGDARRLLEEAEGALIGAPLEPSAVEALRWIAASLVGGS